MLFIDQIQAKDALLRSEFERLFNLALANQAHPGDLLLILENATYNPDVLDYPGEPVSPYVLGPGAEGLSYHTHYNFINNYRQRVHKLTHVEYLAEIERLIAQQNWTERDKLEEQEALTIQLESLIYLKVWESDFIIKKLYHFVCALRGLPFDWHFNISGSAKTQEAEARAQEAKREAEEARERANSIADEASEEDAIKAEAKAEDARNKAKSKERHKILRLLVRDKLQQVSPPVFNALQVAYKSQIRNSIAHSNYSFLGRNLHPNNDVTSDPAAKITNLPFDEWINMFHYTLAIYNELIGLSNKIRQHYALIAAQQNNEIEVAVPNREGVLQSRVIIYRPEFNDFRYK